MSCLRWAEAYIHGDVAIAKWVLHGTHALQSFEIDDTLCRLQVRSKRLIEVISFADFSL